MVRRGSEQGLEAHVSDHPNHCKDRKSAIGSPGIGSDTKFLVEVPHRFTTDHREGSRGIEQVKEAFGNAPLGRIQMDGSRKEGDRLQGHSNDSSRERSHNEANSDSQDY